MILAAVLAGSWSLRSASEDAAARIARTGMVRIGYAVEPPFAFVDAQGRVTGESAEMARAIWLRLGVERIEWMQVDCGSLIPHLRAGRINQIASGLADGLALSSPSIQQLADQHADMERAVPIHNVTLTPGCGAFAFRPAAQALRDRFNRELRGFIGGKAHLALIEPFGFTRESLPGPTAATNKEKKP